MVEKMFAAPVRLSGNVSYSLRRNNALAEVTEAIRRHGVEAAVSLQLVNTNGEIRIVVQNEENIIRQVRDALTTCLLVGALEERNGSEVMCMGILEDPPVEADEHNAE